MEIIKRVVIVPFWLIKNIELPEDWKMILRIIFIIVSAEIIVETIFRLLDID